MTLAAEKGKVKTVIVPPFGFEVDHPRMCDILLQSIPGCRLRSKIKQVTVTIDGVVRTPQTAGHSPPSVPGMQLHVNPAELSYVVFDPLNEDEDAKDRIKRYLRLTSGRRIDSNLRGAETIKGTLDVHRMKTLCREVCCLLDEGAIRIIKGAAPDRADVDELPGKYLLNPGLRTQTTQPTYEEDYEEWVDRLTRSGG